MMPEQVRIGGNRALNMTKSAFSRLKNLSRPRLLNRIMERRTKEKARKETIEDFEQAIIYLEDLRDNDQLKDQIDQDEYNPIIDVIKNDQNRYQGIFEEDKLDEENADLNKIKEVRNNLSVTVLNEIKVICKKNIKTKISLFKKAVKYILNHFADLSTFLEDPKIPIHNNKTERAVGLFVTCRKNFQTVCSDESANRNAKLFTIIQTAQANGLNAEKYLEYVLVSLFEKKDPNSLLPWNGSIPDYIKEPF